MLFNSNIMLTLAIERQHDIARSARAARGLERTPDERPVAAAVTAGVATAPGAPVEPTPSISSVRVRRVTSATGRIRSAEPPSGRSRERTRADV